jgi:hypothetical protein
MDRQSFDEQVVDFVYDELSPAERYEFQQEAQGEPVFAAEAQEFRRISRLYRTQLPDIPVPLALVQQVLARVPKRTKRRFAWFRVEAGSFWRPALTGAFALALTLGLLYQYKQRHDPSFELAKRAPVAARADAPAADRGGELNFQDLAVAAAGQNRPFAAPAWRQPRFNNGLVSFASYGNTPPMEEGTGGDDLLRMEQQAQNAVATFAHQQALRMHAMGDHQGAAEALAVLIKKYPNYPRLFEALALRIGCLFQIGQGDKARQELIWLRQNTPELAQLVEQRWRL